MKCQNNIFDVKRNSLYRLSSEYKMKYNKALEKGKSVSSKVKKSNATQKKSAKEEKKKEAARNLAKKE